MLPTEKIMLRARLHTADLVNNKLLAIKEGEKSIILKSSFCCRIKVF